MAVLTFAQLMTLFHGVTVTMTGLPGQNVRKDYAQNGQPGWKIDQDVIFLNLTEVPDEVNRTRDTIYTHADSSHASEAVSYTRVFECQWTAIGPNSYDLLDTVRYRILTGDILSTLEASGVAPIPDNFAPLRVPYNFNGQWWPRADLSVNFNVGTSRSSSVPYFAHVQVQVSDDNGVQNSFQT